MLLDLMMFMLPKILYFIWNKSIIAWEKMSPFECWFDPFESSQIPFSSHFCIIAVIFLIFDVDLVIIMPIVNIMSNMNISFVYVIMYLFLLIFSLFHEWTNKMFNWLEGYFQL